MSLVILNGSLKVVFHSLLSNVQFLYIAILPLGNSLLLLSSLYMYCVPFLLFK